MKTTKLSARLRLILWLADAPATRRRLQSVGSRFTQLGERIRHLVDDGDFRSRYSKSTYWIRDLEPKAQGIGERWQAGDSTNHKRLTIIAVSYRQPTALLTFLGSMECQTLRNFTVHVLHDGKHDETQKALERFTQHSDLNIVYTFSQIRHNDWGHSLRSQALKEVDSEFVLITNADNYYAPRLTEYAFDVIDNNDLDLLHFNMVHSHDRPGGRMARSYQPFVTKPFNQHIDIGAFIVRSEIAKEVSFRHRGFDADGLFLEDLLDSGLIKRIGHMNKIMLVHN